MGRPGVDRGRHPAAGRGGGRGAEQVVVQHRHGRQGAGAPDDQGPEGGRWRPPGQDHRVRQEQRPRRVHRRALQCQLPALQGRVRARRHLQDRLCAEPDRRLLDQGQGAAHRHLGGHAGHRHRRARGGEPGVLQDRPLTHEVLADGGARHAAVPRPVRPGRAQEVLLLVRLLPEPGILQPEPGHH